MISREDGRRIAIDALLAMEDLQAIADNRDNLHPDYLKEKITRAQRCVEYIRSYCDEGR